MKPAILLSLLSLLASVAGSASAITLDFGNGPNPPMICSATSGTGPYTNCGAGISINQTYGDVAGVVDVTYTNVLSPTNPLVWWPDSYNNLYGVLWAQGSDAASHARIDLVPAAGQQLTLQGFDLGAYSNTTRATNVAVYAIGSATALYTFAGNVGNSNVSATPFSFNLSSATGIRIEFFNSAFNVGIDNIRFDVAPIPEPGTLALMLAGMAALAARARRRR